MSHLIIEQGAEVGREITVPVAGMKFGRSPANDLVLDDGSVMLFHGRFFFKSDGSLWVTDFGTSEKTTVGGLPIDEYQLKVGELVGVGSYAFRVINICAEGDGAKEKPEKSTNAEIDLGFKPSKSGGGGRVPRIAKPVSLVQRVLQVSVILLLLLLLVLGATELLRTDRSADAASRQEGLSFVYECVRTDAGNIFRYQLELTRDGKASIQVDDLRNRHISKSVQLDAADIERLARRLEGVGFFDVDDRMMEVAGRYDYREVAVFFNGNFNHVRVLNREVPPPLGQTISILEDFAFDALDVSFTLLEDDETLVGYAREAFALGWERYSERDSGQENLAKSVKHLEECLAYLETMQPKPEPYPQARKLLESALAEQNRRYEDFMFNVNRAMRLNDWDEAALNLRVLAELISDRSDERYGIISAKQLEVEDKLR